MTTTDEILAEVPASGSLRELDRADYRELKEAG
jgi:hypothetical protein